MSRHRRRERRSERRRAGRDVPRVSRVRLRRLDERRHHARRHGASAGRRRGRREHEHRQRAASGRNTRRPRPPTASSSTASSSSRRSATKARSACMAHPRPATAQDVIGVASFDNTHANLVGILDVARRHADRLHRSGRRPAAAGDGHVPNGANRHARDRRPTAAQPSPPESLTGNVALIRRGTCSLLPESLQRADSGRGGRRAVQQRRRLRFADGRRHAADHHSGRQRSPRRGASLIDGAPPDRPRHVDLDVVDRERAESHRRT